MPECDGDDQELQQQLNEMTYQRDEAVAEIEVLRTDIAQMHQMLATAVLAEGGEIKITRRLLETAPRALTLRTYTDTANDTFVLSVKQ